MSSPTAAPARCAIGTGAKTSLLANSAVPAYASNAVFTKKPMPNSATGTLRRNSSVSKSANIAESMPDNPR